MLDLPRASEHGTLHHRYQLSDGPPPLPRLSLRAATAEKGKISCPPRAPFPSRCVHTSSHPLVTQMPQLIRAAPLQRIQGRALACGTSGHSASSESTSRADMHAGGGAASLPATACPLCR